MPLGIGSLLIFGLAYALAMAEERLQVRKSVPVLVAAAVVWVLVGIQYAVAGQSHVAAEIARKTLLDFAELLLFLIPAMTFVNTLEERGLFEVLRAWLVRRRLSMRAIFWVSGTLAFVVSPIAHNLTTALPPPNCQLGLPKPLATASSTNELSMIVLTSKSLAAGFLLLRSAKASRNWLGFVFGGICITSVMSKS
jgi:citrate transporter